jgi:predicted secreted protein
MAKMNGRDLRIKKDSTILALVNSKSIKIGNTPVDTTNDDDSGFQSMLAKAGTKSLNADVAGFADSVFAAALRTIAMTGTDLQDTYTIEWLDSAGVVTCKSVGLFNLGDYEEKGESAGAVEFTAKLMSSGSFTYVAGP